MGWDVDLIFKWTLFEVMENFSALKKSELGKIEKQSIGNIKAEIASKADLRDLRITSNSRENDEVEWREEEEQEAFEA